MSKIKLHIISGVNVVLVLVYGVPKWVLVWRGHYYSERMEKCWFIQISVLLHNNKLDTLMKAVTEIISKIEDSKIGLIQKIRKNNKIERLVVSTSARPLIHLFIAPKHTHIYTYTILV